MNLRQTSGKQFLSQRSLGEGSRPVWPEYWTLDELEKVKASISIRNWSAQYMQNPTSEEGAI
jgi:hypothetical protein